MLFLNALFCHLRFVLIDEDIPLVTSPFSLQPQRARNRETSNGPSETCSSQERSEHVFITQIHATDVVSSLRRLPAGFYVAVEFDGKSEKTSSKTVLIGKDAVEWDDEILLPSERSSVILFKVFASFELGPSLGNGEFLSEFGITVRDVLDLNEQQHPIRCIRSNRNDELDVSSMSLRIVIERRNCNVNVCTARPDVPQSETDQMAHLTDTGHHALLHYRQLQNQSDLDHAIRYFEHARGVCPSTYHNRSALLFNLATANFIHCQTHGLDLDFPITLYRDALQLRASRHLDHCATALHLSFALLARFHRQGAKEDKIEAESLLQGVARLSPPDSYAYRAACIALNTSMSISAIESRTYQEGNGDANHEELIRKARELLLGSDRLGAPHQLILLADGGMSLYRRFKDRREVADIHEAILMLETATELTPNGHVDKAAWLNGLSRSILYRFERLGDIADIHKSISVAEDAVWLTRNGHPERPASLNSLGYSLCRRFERLGDPADISKSVLVIEEAVRLTPDGHPDKPERLSNLGMSLSRCSGRFGDLAALDKAISIQEEAVRLTPDGHPYMLVFLNNLGNFLSERFDELGDLTDLSKSISVQEEAVHLAPDGHRHKPALLSNLGVSLSIRYDRLDDIEDISKSIVVGEEAVRLAPGDDPVKLTWLESLGNSLFRRFLRLGDLADLNRSISVKEEAVSLTPNDHPGKPGVLLNLASSFATRFDWLGDLMDINKAISVGEEALRLTPDGHPDRRNRLNNLGISLSGRFRRLGDIADLHKSILAFEEAVRLTPSGHSNRPERLSNLGNSLLDRSLQLGDLTDIHKSILVQEEAVRLTPDDHPYKPERLKNLGSSLSHCFDRLDDFASLDKAILMEEQAVHLTPDGHPAKPARLNALGKALSKHFSLRQDPSSLTSAISHFQTAATSQSGPASVRFSAVRNWISSVHLGGGSQPPVLDAYITGINLLSELAWVGLPLAERHHVLLDTAGLTRDAAAAALVAGRPNLAVELLEQGRSIVWNQFLQLRTPVEDLRATYPALADQFEQISRELEHASSREAMFRRSEDDKVSRPVSLEEEVQRHQGLALKRDKLLVEIRTLPGFDRFLLPKTIQKLAALAKSGPVAYLNASGQRCDALIVVPDSQNALLVPLPNISYSRVDELRRLLRLLLERNRLVISRSDICSLISTEENSNSQQLLNILLKEDNVERGVKVKPQIVEGYDPEELFRRLLEYLWVNAVQPVLDALRFTALSSDGEKLPHIFWCPTGPFAFLPIHAAGLYNKTEAGTKLSDFAVSSYIPTISDSLAPLDQDDALNHPSHRTRLVTVPQPATDGLGRLALVDEEINHIKELSAKSPFATLEISDGTFEDVTKKMANSDWVHFACHGVQDPKYPLDSGLCLADGRRLRLLDIIRLSRPPGGLAYLSACQTAQGDEQLPEESVHLAAGMLLAGYGSVVATMWAIRDADAPKVTRAVYAHLFRDGKVPDSSEAAEALHDAVQGLRKSGASFTSWVPFIHVGR